MGGTAQPGPKFAWKYFLLYVVASASVLPFARLFEVASINDEGIVCLGAVRILLGDSIYTDFTTHFSPGIYYVAVLMYLLFGETIEATRLGMALITGCLGLLIYLLGTRLLGVRLALVPYFMFLGAGVTQWPILSYHWLGTMAYLFGVWALMLWLEQPTVARAALVGGALALSVWSLQSSAAALVILALAVALWKRKMFTVRHLGSTLLACLFCSGVLWLHIFLGSTPQEVWTQNVLWLVEHNAKPGQSSYDLGNITGRWAGFSQSFDSAPRNLATAQWALHSLSYLLMWTVNYAALYPTFLLAAVLWYFRREQEPLTLILMAQGILLLVWQSRQTMLYLNFLTPLFFIVLIWSLVVIATNRPKLQATLIGGVLGIYLSAYAFQCKDTSTYRWPIHTVRGVLYLNDRQVAEAWQQTFWQASRLTPPGTKAFCFPYAMGFSFLSGVRPVGRFLVLIPILGPDHEVPALIEEINEEKVPYIYHSGWSESALHAVPTVDKVRFFELAQEYHDEILDEYELVQVLPAGQQLYRRQEKSERRP